MGMNDTVTPAVRRSRTSQLHAAAAGTALAIAAAWMSPARADGGCDPPKLALDPAITAAVLDRDWASGASHAEPVAVIELRCAGALVDSLPLHAPLARLEPGPLRGVPTPTWLVTEDLTAPAGTTSGPATLLVEIADRRLRFATAATPDGRRQPIVLADTGKAAWRAARSGAADDYLLVSCQPVAGDFTTSYRRYHLSPQGWTVQSLRRHELWESGGDFPPASQFP